MATDIDATRQQFEGKESQLAFSVWQRPSCGFTISRVLRNQRATRSWGKIMLWWAYAGLSGSIVLSFSSAALLLGMKPERVAQPTVEALIAFLLTGLVVHACATLLRLSSKGPHGKVSPTSEALLLPQRHAVHAAAKPPAPEPPKRSRYALADLKSPAPEHA